MRALSLLHTGSPLTSGSEQLRILTAGSARLGRLPSFSSKLAECEINPLRPRNLEILQLNIGKMCNQTCRHCHVDAGPDRKEIMTREVMKQCVALVAEHKIPTVDITGGAPELNPDFRWLVEELSLAGKEIPNFKILDRCNLTIILSNDRFSDLPHFFAEHNITVICSLPFYEKSFTDRQRGDGVFEKSIEALRLLNAEGYASPGKDLELNLVYNPSGAFLPGDQASLEKEFRTNLRNRFQIEFNNLYCITNLPISRFLEFLIESGNLDDYMQKLVDSFNPAAALGIMCRNTLSVGWEGTLYDCDFNQMLDLPVASRECTNVRDFNRSALQRRAIVTGQHCYGCTAGAGSSCGGSVAKTGK